VRDQERKSQEFWDGIAANDEPGGLHGLLSRDARIAAYRDAAEKAVLLDRMGDRLRGGALLEVGCGGGRWTVWLAPRFDRVLASDISAGMIDRARERVREAGLSHVELVAASMEELRVDGSFGTVYLSSCLHYMSDDAIEEGLANVARHTDPGALLLSRDTVSLTGAAFHRSERYGGDDPAIYRPAQWYADAMARHGFHRFDAWPTYVTPLAWRIRKVLPDRVLAAALAAELRVASAEVRAHRLLHHPGDKDHLFFAYQKSR
jgi:ubiquinone/menaquinone biosynthesis C-methylase UbiE